MREIINYIKKNKKYIITIFAITFIWGIVAYGYMFFNNNFTHDSFMESIATQEVINWKMSLGRIFYAPYIYLARGTLILPWLIGIISLIFLSIASILVLKMFKIKDDNYWLNILVPGILTVNNTVIALCGSYLQDMDVDMFAMLMSVLAVYLWKNSKKGYLYGIIPLLLSIGLYQSYISVSLSLIIFLSIIELLKGNKYQEVLKRGLKAIAMFLITGIIYLCLLKLMPIIFNTNLISGGYNSIDSILNMSFVDIVKETGFTYLSSIKNFLLPVTVYNNVFVIMINIILVLSAGYVIINKIFTENINNTSKLMIILLILLLPLAMNICRVLTNGMSHSLMIYALWLIYLFILLILNDENCHKLKMLCIILTTIICIGNIRLANAVFMVKDIAKEQTENYLNRVLHDIENHEYYIYGETKVVIIGIPNMKTEFHNSTDQIRRLVGNTNDFVIPTGEASRYKLYFSRVLHSNVNVIENQINDIYILDQIENMPIYPEKNSIQYFYDVLIVKLG
jgi:hypothetical protein